jgi:hypothetical protein
MDLSSPDRQDLAETDTKIGYEEKRLLMKMSPLAAGIIVVQSTIGVSVFTLHQPLAKVGLVFGFIVSIFSCYITIYGATRLDWVATSMEKKDPSRNVRIKNAYELFSLIQGESMGFLKWLTIISNIALTAASSIGNLIVLGMDKSSRPVSRTLLQCATVHHQARFGLRDVLCLRHSGRT